MTEDQVISTIMTHIEGQFPLVCKNCGHQFKTLKEYLQNTTHQGAPISYDAEQHNWNPLPSMGTISMSNCSCGNTLALSSVNMKLLTMWQLLRWAKKETARQCISIRELLVQLRDKIDFQVLHENPKDS